MATSTHLFDLIKTLSKNEKRYFRLFCKFQEGEKNYLRLFDFLSKQARNDETEIQAYFAEETFVKSLHVTKNYLYQLILKSLRAYHGQSHIDQIIGDRIADMLLLEDRGLYHQARQVLLKAKKLSTKHHRYFYLVYLIRKEATYHFSIDEKRMWENIERINKELRSATTILEEESRMYELYHQSAYLIRSKHKTKTILDHLKKELIEHSNDFSIRSTRSFYSCYLEDSIHFAVAYEEGNITNQYKHAKQVIDWWRANKQMTDWEPHIYKIHLSNFLFAAFKSKAFKYYPPILKELAALPSRNFNEEAETFQNLTFYQLLYFLNTKRLDTALEALAEIIEGLDKYKLKINKARELAFYYNISVLYFMLNDIDNALLWLNKILHHPKTDRRKDIQRFAEILQLFYHYNLGNFDLLLNLILSVKRKLKRWQDLSDFEKILIESLQQLLQIPSRKERKQKLLSIKDQLNFFAETTQETTPIGFEEIQIWIEAEIQ